MIIEIKNFGIIDNFKYNLEKDFTLIFGKNNTGKSYAISVVYLIIKNLYHLDERDIYQTETFDDVSNKLVKYCLEQLDDEKIKEFNIKTKIEDSLKILLTYSFVKSLQESFKSTFDSISTLSNQISKVPFEIIITMDFLTITISEKDEKLTLSNLEIFKDAIFIRRSQRNLNNKYNEKNPIIYTSSDEDTFRRNVYMYLINSSLTLRNEVSKSIKNIYYLPASRSGLYQALSAFGQIIAELSKSRKFTSKKIELPSISEPLSDYFIGLSNIQKKNKKDDNSIIQAAKNIEENILNGKVDFDKSTQKLMFSPKNTDLKLDLSYTSSMVSEITPIVSYLRYIINQEEEDVFSFSYRRGRFGRKSSTAKPIIIIEEPEAHLHPEVQIKLINEFVQLAKNDVKFIITTHSNYIFNKVNNLILSEDINIDKAASLYFDESSFGSKSSEITINRYGVKDKNFSKASQELYEEKIALIEKYNEEH